MEIWKKIRNSDRYQVSNLGGLKSINKNGKSKSIVPADTSAGYIKYNLRINGAIKRCAVHRLVAEAFIPNPNNLPQVHHINGIRNDNRIENLKWACAKYNISRRIHLENEMPEFKKDLLNHLLTVIERNNITNLSGLLQYLKT